MSFRNALVSTLINQRNYVALQEYLQIEFPNNEDVMVMEYDGEKPRLFKDENENIVLMLPDTLDAYMENAVVDAIENGTIFDDANTVHNTAKYIRLTSLPYNGLMNNNIGEPKALTSAVGSVIGTMNHEGRFGTDDADIKNGENAMKDLVKHADNNGGTIKLVGDYIDLKKNGKLPKPYRMSLAKVGNEVDKVKEVKCDDCLTPDDYSELKLTDECGSSCVTDIEETDEITPPDTSTSNTSTSSYANNGSSDNDNSSSESDETESSYADNGSNDNIQEGYVQEGLFTKKPKKLKPITRDVIAYITIEIGAIKDPNDQAMIAGYTCSKLELVDFYLNCIDTQDDRYIVPHTRQYLVQMQNELNRLLTRILQIRPMNKMDRIWKPGVTLPMTGVY